MFNAIKDISTLWTVTMRMVKFQQMLFKGQTLDEGQEKLLKLGLEVKSLEDRENTLYLLEEWFKHVNVHYGLLKDKEEREK